MFPQTYVGRFCSGAVHPFAALAPPPAARIFDQTEWLSSNMDLDPAKLMLASIRSLELTDETGAKGQPLPMWFQELENRLPALFALKLRLCPSKAPCVLKHRNLTVLVINRNSGKLFSIDGEHLPSLNKLCIFGSHTGGVIVSKFKVLSHLSVGDMDSAFSCSAVPALQSLLVSCISGAIKIDAPNLQILSLGRNCEGVHFATPPTSLSSLSFVLSPRAVELATRVLKRLGKLACLSNLVDIQVALNRKFLRKGIAKQQEISIKSFASVCKAICGAPGTADLFTFLKKLLTICVGCLQSSRESQAPYQPTSWQISSRVRGPHPHRHLFECLRANAWII
jgi:hypothetical protein